MEQTDDVLKPYYKTIRSLLKLRNEKDILHIFREENMECVWYNHDNWNGGIDFYQLQINVSPFLYDKLNQEDVHKKLLELFKQVIPTESIVVDGVNIVPDVSVDARMEEAVNYKSNLKIFVAHIDYPYIFNQDVKVSEYPCLSLLSNNWDDYDTEASFGLSYYDALGKRKFIGKLKIIGDVQKDKDGHSRIYKSLVDGKCEIEKGMCSLGQDLDYYRHIKDSFGDEYMNVLYALRDCSVFPYFAKQFENNTWLYKKCLIRTDEAERTKREAPYLLKNMDLEDRYSFDYLFKPNYADEPVKIHFNFRNGGQIPNRLYAIIGKNGVGKTQFITTLPMNIYKKAKDFFHPQVPIFSKVIAVSNCPFDHFEIPHQTVEFQYVYCGMSVLRNGYKTILADEDIKDKLHENLIEIKSCNRLGHLQNILSPLFSEEELDDIINCEQFEKEKDWLDAIDAKYEIFSSGQNTFLYLFSSVVANIRYDSLLLFDEPETHLHPNAITLLMTAINRLLERYQSYGIIVTHSPLIIKELFSRNVYIMKRMNNVSSVKRIGMESFGENLTNLTEEVFDNKDITPYYVKMLKGLIDNGLGYEEIVRLVQSEDIPVSLNLTILLRTLIENKNNEEIKHYQYNSLDFHKKVVNSKRNTKEDVDKKKRLTALLPTSQKAFADYDAKFSRNVLQTLTPIRLSKQEEADYIGLYDFHSSVFTQLFDRLTTNDGVDDSLCPYCTIGEASSLDHIVPKTVMPVFADHPKNLIPCCSNCNSKKSNKWFADNNWDYINLYLDELPNKQFLFVDLAIDNKTLKVKFYIDNRNHIDENLFLKISNHYIKLDLCRRFEQYSNQEISEVATLIKSFSKCVKDDKCKEVILDSCMELQRQFGFNYWKAILRSECCNNKSVYQFLKTK